MSNVLAEKAMSLTTLWSRLGKLRDELINHINSPSDIEILEDEIKELKQFIAKTEREVGLNQAELTRLEMQFPSYPLMGLYQKECQVLEHHSDETGLE
jgi:hypothetical protein